MTIAAGNPVVPDVVSMVEGDGLIDLLALIGVKRAPDPAHEEAGGADDESQHRPQTGARCGICPPRERRATLWCVRGILHDVKRLQRRRGTAISPPPSSIRQFPWTGHTAGERIGRSPRVGEIAKATSSRVNASTPEPRADLADGSGAQNDGARSRDSCPRADRVNGTLWPIAAERMDRSHSHR